MASQIVKLETNVQLNASAEQFYDVFCSKTHHIANVCPEKVEGVEIHEGEWGTEGSIICWNYVHDGKKGVAKELVEFIDRENNKITFKVLEGDLLGYYKSFKFILQVIPQQKGSIAHWILEYEKLKDHTTPDPHSLLQLDNWKEFGMPIWKEEIKNQALSKQLPEQMQVYVLKQKAANRGLSCSLQRADSSSNISCSLQRADSSSNISCSLQRVSTDLLRILFPDQIRNWGGGPTAPIRAPTGQITLG